MKQGFSSAAVGRVAATGSAPRAESNSFVTRPAGCGFLRCVFDRQPPGRCFDASTTIRAVANKRSVRINTRMKNFLSGKLTSGRFNLEQEPYSKPNRPRLLIQERLFITNVASFWQRSYPGKNRIQQRAVSVAVGVSSLA